MKKFLFGIFVTIVLVALAYFAFLAPNPWFALNSDNAVTPPPTASEYESFLIRENTKLIQQNVIQLADGRFPIGQHITVERFMDAVCVISAHSKVTPSFPNGTLSNPITYSMTLQLVRKYAKNPESIVLPSGVSEFDPITVEAYGALLRHLDVFK